MQNILNSENGKMLELGIIKPVTGCCPWLSTLCLVPKKDGTHTVVFDARKLNFVCLPDIYPIPLIDTIIGKLRDASFLNSVNLKYAFFQIPLE